MIPSMGGTEIGPILKKYASQVNSGQAIVELGCWLGAGTRQLLDGVQQSGRDVVVHSFDKFQVKGHQKEKAAAFGVNLKDSFQEFQKTFSTELTEQRLEVYWCKIEKATWNGPEIGVHVDDACKRQPAFDHAIKTFSPFWVPGETVVVLMDFWYFLKCKKSGLRYQFEWLEGNQHCFTELEQLDKSTYTIVLRYLGGLNNVS